ncbi:MAG: type II secretion system F family protein [Propionibacteriales bacterium]|nr:type II secretion system F family protein [Propionibacteriales bacterium]
MRLSTGLPLLCATCAAAAVLLSWPPGRWVLAVRLGAGAVVDGDAVRRLVAGAGRRLRAGWGGWLPVAVAGGLAPWVATSPVPAVLLATAAGCALAGWRLMNRARARRAASELAERVAASLELLAAELRAGVLPAEALRNAGDDLPELRQVSEAAGRGGDVAAALDVVARRPGADDLAQVAAAWRVAERSGAPVADVLDRVVDAVRSDRDLGREVRAECASSRATARLLAVLPVLGLALGSGLGGDPVHVLTATLPGASCLAAGCALALLGLVWVERIVATAEARR